MTTPIAVFKAYRYWWLTLSMMLTMHSLVLAQANFNCTPPAPNALCTPPTTFDEDITVPTGTTKFWDQITSTDPQNITTKIRIKGGGKVIVRNNNNVMLKSATAVLNIENIEFIVDGGNLQLDVSGCRYLQNGGALRTYGNFQQTTLTIICITGTTIEIGEEEVGGRFNSTGNNNTAANWQNDGGYRYLKNNCINVTQDFQLQSTGSGTGISGVDVIIDCCIEIGDRGLNHATPTAFGNKDDDDSGNWQNSNSQSIYGTEIVVANGNYQNNQGIMTLCSVDIKVNVTGSFQINSGTLRGQNLCIGVEDIFENSATWTLTGISWYSEKQNSTNVPGAGAEKTKTTVLACFDNNCCANLVACVTPSAIQLAKTAPACTGATANNNGKITLVTATNTDKCGISTLGATTYDGPAYASATAYSANKDVKTSIPNTGGTYILRLFNGTNDCFKDTTITVAAVTCSATCTLTLKPTVSGCYQNNGSKATVSVEVAWTNATVSPTANDASDAITVTFAGQTRTINPGAYTSSGGSGTIVSPQVVAFELPADASTQAVQAFIGTDYASATCKIEQTGIVLPAACPPTECVAGQTGGTVWNDYNADGIKQAGENSGVIGVTVKAYDCNGTLIGTATTDAFGKYVFTNITTNAYPIRVEFSTLPAYASQGTINGTDGRTTVQFVNAADCNVDLGILDPTDYCQTNPQIIVPCYLNGNPDDVGSATEPALVSFAYDLTGSKTVVAKIPDVGPVWGLAYNKNNNTLYSAAFLRRHIGLKAEGLGGIFQTNLSTNTTTTLVDVETIGVDLGSVADNATRGVNVAKTQPSIDEDGFTKLGKVGMGDLDISADGSMLYFVNLHQKTLHRLSISSPTAAPGVAIPNPGCANGEYRPWALKIYKGNAYVGVVCDASSGTKSDLRAFVYQYDLNTNTFNSTPVFDFPLTYPKGYPWDGNTTITGWYPWTDDPSVSFVTLGQSGSYGDVLVYPQPILSDIEFDIDGSLVLGFADRFGLQTGNQNARPSGSPTYGLSGSGYSSVVGGDILRAFSNGSSFILENNAKAGSTTGSGADNNQGPGFGEFYNDNFFVGVRLAHTENGNGGLAIKPGSGETVYSAMDPVNGKAESGGIRKVNNTSGQPTGALSVYSGFISQGLFAKAAGIGDVELNCALPSYLEIGNRVWNDVNKNGVQDPCEKVLVGVNVSLYKGNTLLAGTQTDANGEYYFSSKSKIGTGTWAGSGADTTLLPNTAYKLVFGESQLSGGKLKIAGLGQFELTLKDATASNGNDQNDSDAEIISGAFCINLTTGALATVNHTFDAGFYCTNPPIAATFTQTSPTCNILTPNNNGKVTLTASVAPYDKFRTRLSTAAWGTDSSYATATAIGTTFPTDLITTAPNAGATYVIRFYTGECCYRDTTITVLPKPCVVGSIGDFVWKDANRNGRQDAGEVGVNGVKVILWSATTTGSPVAKLDSATTAGAGANAGKYLFSNLPKGDYVVQFVKSTIPAECSGFTAKDTTVVGTTDKNDSDADKVTGITAKVSLDPKVLSGTSTPADSLATNNLTVDAGLVAALGSIGDLIWKDVNDNGLQDLPTEKGVSGIKVNLYAASGGTKTGAILQTKTTGTDGLYLFTGLLAGDYIVEIDKTTLKDTCAITTKQNTGSDDTKDSDFDPTSGLSQVITLNPVFNPTTPTEQLATNNLTVDAGLVKVCIVPTRTVAATDPTCAVAGKIELTATNGDKYGLSKGATYTGPAYASATAVGTLPVLIKGNISHAADSTWTIRVFNKDNTCFKDTTVTVKALVKDATISVNNGFPACRSNGTAYTIKFTKSPAGSVVTAKNVATGAVIAVTGDSVANVPLTVAKVRLIVTNGVCKDSVEVSAPTCDKPVGSIGDLIWKDTNDNGLQDLPTEIGVAGIKVNLYAASSGTKTGSILQTKTTGTDGLYLFTGLLAGDYIVEIDKTTLPNTCEITSKQNIPSDDTKDSDFDPTSGLSQVITLNPVFNPTTPTELLATNNLTVDAGLVVPCVKSQVTLTGAPVCSADVQTYSITFNVTGKNGIIKVSKGTLTGANPYTVTGIPSGATLKITDSLSAVCKFDTLITGPNCNCNPPLPILLTSSVTACAGDTFPTLKATVVGLATVEWFTQATGGSVVFTGLNYKPSGTVPSTGAVFYAQARSTDPTCPAAISTSRVMATINAQDCTKEVDLALKKSINTKIAQIGDVLTYTLKVWNESNVNATGVEVTDSIATTVQFQTGSFVASRGSASITGNVIKWVIGNIAAAGVPANGDTVTLTYRVKATQEGVHFNTAEICKTNEKDTDSTPCNHKDDEDDIDRQCFTVPVKLCAGEKVQASVPSTYTNVKWFKDGSNTPIASGNVVLLSDVGSYTYTATNQTCPAGGCCPIIIEEGANCCPTELCIPFTVKKRKK